MSRIRQIVGLLVTITAITACQNGSKTTTLPDEFISPKTGTKKELTLDSIYLYAKQLYRWQESLPSYTTFDPREKYAQIEPEQTAYERELFALSQYALRIKEKPYEWSTIPNKPKYSYLERRRTEKKSSGHMASTATPYRYATHLSYWAAGNKRIAYVYIPSFPELQTVKAELDQFAAELAQQQVTHLILDLRHNGGGYVETAEYLANLISPAKLDKKVMFSEQFHPNVQQGKAKLLLKQPYLDANGKVVQYKGRPATMADVDYSEKANTHYFIKKGHFNSLQQLSCIVSERTASASELLISSFKPYLPLRLIGQQTFGKPVGFFSIRVGAFDIYLASFLIRNADGWSDYFDGIPVDLPLAPLETSRHPGDPKEAWLAAALKDITKDENLTAISSVTYLPVPAEENLLLKTNFKLK
ncbi:MULTISPECIES: S41 family peptidase [Sphingobacterium]|uniref:S41 family peptidase n=1 Tax=Sphingobacterium TaxID=28453 RepID=UPI00257FEE77|nr:MULTISPECIES: S41 family peptidase [Sphingobacterium]